MAPQSNCADRANDPLVHILLVDDHPVVRMGFAALLKQLDAALVFHEAEDRQQALELAARVSPSVILLDLTLSGSLELALIAELKEQSPASSILVVSMHEEQLYAENALRAGARGYMMKHRASQSIIQAVRTLLDGSIWLSDEMRHLLAVKTPGEPGKDSAKGIASLSGNELGVFRLLGLGLKKSQIAERLCIPDDSVERCRTQLRQKLGLATGAELYRAAFLHLQREQRNGEC